MRMFEKIVKAGVAGVALIFLAGLVLPASAAGWVANWVRPILILGFWVQPLNSGIERTSKSTRLTARVLERPFFFTKTSSG